MGGFSSRALFFLFLILSCLPALAVTVSPTSVVLQENATQQFTASVASTWTTTCGKITSAGLYTAPLYPSTTCTVTATGSNGSGTATARLAIVSPIVLTPPSATTVLGNTQQFIASVPVTWSAKCGTITASGLFTATATFGTYCTITATATVAPKYTAYGYDKVAAPSTFAISPLNPTVQEGATVQFKTNGNPTYIASCGTITAAGLYTAPLTPGPCTVTAKSASATLASTTATVTTPLVITPTSAATAAGLTQQFKANAAVTWAASCGSINATGLYTASANPGSACIIQATAATGTAYTANVVDTIAAGQALTISPPSATVSESSTQQFTANESVTWTATCGSIGATTGLFTAPLATGTCTVTGTPVYGGTGASAVVTITSSITVTPAAVNLHALNTQTFTASSAVTWATSCGSISAAGVFTAPAAAGSCTITATTTGTTAFTAQSTASIDVGNQVRCRNSSRGTGLQSDELVLTPANVNATNMAQVWTATVDGGVWGQPLYMNGITINGVPHNVLYGATDNGAQLWKVSLIPPGASAVTGTMVGDTNFAAIGVLSTPVIDGRAMYVVSETAEQNATYFPHRLHALDITTGNELYGGPVLASDPGLPPIKKLQRPGLTVANGNVYVGFGSMEDSLPYHGVLLAFNETSLVETASWNSTPTGSAGGIWQAGGAPSVDSAGNVYVLTGNGTADGVTNFGQSAVKLSPSLQLLDFFTSYNAVALSAADLDLGSASVPVMPDQNGQYPHELIFCGKYPTIYVVNRDSLGGYNTVADNIVQELPNAVGGTATKRDSGEACFTSPSAWGGNIYFAANGDVLKQFTLDPNSGLLSTAPVYQGAFAYGWPGSQSVISSNGNTNGIIWTFDNVAKKLHADNASDVSIPLWVSPAINTGYLKWTTPAVINGHVYVGGKGTVVAFAPLH